MIKQIWNDTTPQFKMFVIAPIGVFLGYKLALELWCVAYGFGMQLGLL